jgi:N-acetylglucosamine malate deacetylase 2
MLDRATVRSESFASLLQSLVALVVAHPDDETLGLGGCLAQIPAPIIIHLTDGVPRDPSDAARAGFSSREQYVQARRCELDRALAAAAVSEDRRVALSEIDQESVLHLVELTRELIPVLAGVEWVITHPYEGGHPDHDAAAFIVQAGCARLQRAIGRAPHRLEFASYHLRDGQIVRGEFWPDPGCLESTFTLDASQRARKRAALSKFITQRTVIAAFPTDVERLRPAPSYDFSAPPPPGVALYDRFGWPMSSAVWRSEAVRALAALEITASVKPETGTRAERCAPPP